MNKLRSGRSYASASLDDNSSSADLKQSTIQFRKRRHPPPTDTKLKNTTENISDLLSPTKRSKLAAMSSTLTRSKARRHTTKHSEAVESSLPVSSQLRSPLKEINTRATTDMVTCSPVSKTKGAEVDYSTPTQKTPSNPSTPARRVRKKLDFDGTAAVKKSLHGSLPSTMLCREEQLATLTAYITSHLSNKKPGSLYISGAPGTGKTACLSHILNNSTELLKSISVVMVNCMSVKQPHAIFTRIASELLGQKAAKLKTISSLQDALEKYMSTTKKMVLIVLDEVDQLDCRGQEVLYTLFEWPALPSSKLLLIGIANALDLTDRVLPRLQSHVKCCPHLVHFPPYTKDQIVTILQSRLSCDSSTSESQAAIIDPMAIQFCARKVSAVHGDLRKALDICRRAVELAETRQKMIGSFDKPTTQLSQKPKIRVTLPLIASVISEVYTSNVTSLTVQQNFPLQQKLAVCTLLCMVRGRHTKEVTLGKLHEAYVRVCRQRQLRYEGESEFVGVCNMLEARGVISLKNSKTKETRLIKVALRLEEADIEHALQDKILLSSMLEQGIPSH